MEDHSGHGRPGNERRTEHKGSAIQGTALLGGLSVEASGFQFVTSEPRLSTGVNDEWAFEVLDRDGSIVTDFEESHGKKGHLIVVRRDLTEFQHLHPQPNSAGTWRVQPLSLNRPGVYRAFVDIVVDGTPVTLGHDLFVDGVWNAEPRPGSSRVANVDGYSVTLLTEDVRLNLETELRFEVGRDGTLVSRLDDYLGALGHLVALREGDLGYLHAHPVETDAENGQLVFSALFPTRGRYRLFLQTKPNGELVTTSFDLTIE